MKHGLAGRFWALAAASMLVVGCGKVSSTSAGSTGDPCTEHSDCEGVCYIEASEDLFSRDAADWHRWCASWEGVEPCGDGEVYVDDLWEWEGEDACVSSRACWTDDDCRRWEDCARIGVSLESWPFEDEYGICLSD